MLKSGQQKTMRRSLWRSLDFCTNAIAALFYNLLLQWDQNETKLEGETRTKSWHLLSSTSAIAVHMYCAESSCRYCLSPWVALQHTMKVTSKAVYVNSFRPVFSLAAWAIRRLKSLLKLEGVRKSRSMVNYSEKHMTMNFEPDSTAIIL